MQAEQSATESSVKKFYRLEERPGYEGCEYTVFYLVKETPKGYWISRRKLGEVFRLQLEATKEPWKSFGFIWVSKTAKKRYAYPTKEEARKSFIIRSNKYIEILESRLERRRIALTQVQSGDIGIYEPFKLLEKLTH